MITTCPYPCDNKTEYGFCKTTGCINKDYRYLMSNIEIPYAQPIPRPCKTCANHPSNGGSGICFCTLGMVKVTC